MSSQRIPIKAEKGIHLPIFSQAIKYGGMVYVSGNVGMDYPSMTLADGGILEQTRKTIENMKLVLEEGGSSLNNLVKVNIYLTTMENFAAMNKAYVEYIKEPMPARTCVAVKELPFGALVEIEGTAHL